VFIKIAGKRTGKLMGQEISGYNSERLSGFVPDDDGKTIGVGLETVCQLGQGNMKGKAVLTTEGMKLTDHSLYRGLIIHYPVRRCL